MRKTIAVFTAARSDLAPLGPVIAALRSHGEVDAVVIATGGHLQSSRGDTLQFIEASEDELEVVRVELQDAEPATLVAAFGPISAGVGEVLQRRRVDTLVVLGDRWELLAATSAAVVHGVAIAHLHGGELTEGALDDRVRHAVTKLSDLHCCATEDSAARLRQLGENSDRIVVTGAPGLDRHAGWVRSTDEQLAAALGHPVARPVGFVTYHPETVDRGGVRERAEMVLAAAADALGTMIVTYPGIDSGADVVIEVIESLGAAHDHIVVRPHLGDVFPVVLAGVDIMIGNSSAGIWEAATFAIPAVDIGARQAGRFRPRNVLHADHDPTELAAIIAEALDPTFRDQLVGMKNPYGDGRSSKRILEAILLLPGERPLRKDFVDRRP